MIGRNPIFIRDTDTGIDPGFVDIKSTAVFVEDFGHRDPPVIDYRVGGN